MKTVMHEQFVHKGKWLLQLLVFLLIGHTYFAQVYLHDFGTTTISGNPYTVAPTTLDANLSNSSWSTSTGAFTSFAGASGQALSLNNSGGTPTYTLTFDIAGGCSLDLTSFNFWRQRSSTGAQNWSMTINGTNVGSGTVPTAGAYIGATPLVGFTGLTGTVTIVISLSGASGSGTFRLDDFQLTGSTSCGPPSNTITTGAVSGGPFNVNCTGTTASGSVAYTSTGTWNAGNTFTVQLSDASGSFLSPTVIGSLATTSGSGSINFTIPANTPTGAGYLIRIVSSNPAFTGSSSTPFTITQLGSCVLQQPYFSSIIYDGCNGTCGLGEGTSEILFGHTGDYTIAVNTGNIILDYLTGGTTLTNTLFDVPATTTAMNTAAGCPGLFVDAFGATIPTNASFLLVSSNLCVDALVWSSLCGQGPIYVVYANNNWQNLGNFGNSGGQKDFDITFTTNGGTFTTSYNYIAPGSGTDGNYATYGMSGGSPVTQGNFPTCQLSPVVLPTVLHSYNLENHFDGVEVEWITFSEENVSHFEILHADESLNWKSVNIQPSLGDERTMRSYGYFHRECQPGINYYKLVAHDLDGESQMIGLKMIKRATPFVYYQHEGQILKLDKQRSIEVYDTTGKLIISSEDQGEFYFPYQGIFVVKDLMTGENQRILITN